MVEWWVWWEFKYWTSLPLPLFGMTTNLWSSRAFHEGVESETATIWEIGDQMTTRSTYSSIIKKTGFIKSWRMTCADNIIDWNVLRSRIPISLQILVQPKRSFANPGPYTTTWSTLNLRVSDLEVLNSLIYSPNRTVPYYAKERLRSEKINN
jgi:hypothetical protein